MIQALFLAAIIPSVIVHEVSHGAVAYMFGDDTAKRAGRLTLNPIPHIDPFGTVLLPLMLSFSGLGAFGYAKPVPVNPAQMRSPRNHGLIVSLAGPAVNIIIAVAAAFTLRYLRPELTPQLVAAHFQGDTIGSAPPFGDQFLFALGLANVILAAFNLLPLPPLDGSAVFERVLPKAWLPRYMRIRPYSVGIVLVLVLLLPGLLQRSVFSPAVDLWANLLA